MTTKGWLFTKGRPFDYAFPKRGKGRMNPSLFQLANESGGENTLLLRIFVEKIKQKNRLITQAVFMEDDSKTNTIPGYRFAVEPFVLRIGALGAKWV